MMENVPLIETSKSTETKKKRKNIDGHKRGKIGNGSQKPALL